MQVISTVMRRRRRAPVLVVALAAVLTLTLSTAAAAAGSSVTKRAPAGGSVTVDVTKDLVDQTVHVSWQGFKPSLGFFDARIYPVRVYQCRGADPAGPEACYGSSVYDYPGKGSNSSPGATLPDGPANFLNAGTSSKGDGSVDIETRTVRESNSLGCDSTHLCSVVVVPNYGDPKQPGNTSLATLQTIDAPYAWKNHVAIPITFAPSGATCPLGDAGLTSVGSPLSERAITSWQPAACQGTTSVNIDYTAVGEAQGRAQFLAGSMDVGLTTLPADPAVTSAHAYTYAPIDVGAISVSFHVDDAVTQQPITSMKLNARLVAKLLTESYGGFGTVAPGAPVGPGNPATVGNPKTIFADPEFTALNPGPAWPGTNPTNPIVVSGNTDLMWELTRWVASDPAAVAFLNGTPDQSGMHVNTNFKGISYPISSLELRDPYTPDTYAFVPIDGLALVARSLVVNQPSAANPIVDPVTHTHLKVARQDPGARALIAFVDSASAAAFNFPNAALKNASGKYLLPTADAMSAAVTAMTVNANKLTRQANFASTDPAVYPLTMVGYAMVPTSATAPAKITNIVRFLDFAAGPGQQPSLGLGGLPAGFLALPAELLAQTKAASTAVQAQSGTKPASPSPTPSTTRAPTTPSSSGGGSNGSSGASSNTGGSSTGTTSGTTNNPAPRISSSNTGQTSKRPSVVSVAAANTPGPKAITSSAVSSAPPWYVRLALPLLLLIGLAATLFGPALVAVGKGVRPTLPNWAGPWSRLRRKHRA